MFASLLPGLRELRTPLATGYLYLLSLCPAPGHPRTTRRPVLPLGAHARRPSRLEVEDDAEPDGRSWWAGPAWS
ncbi:hypothetical protein GCM10010211_85990 [Streptomyces albospinus]|uniref:Uncharacterized protein n=1 Tax=Streptomyces albospinus TaxID=285515 RepID=A0ABQ2VQA9_9ACTN|nr:hypothetical protein [Streptomyces albospinus]GGV06863.1 hypothetical protein GCM10010211_85990 [Streptomyces albospinus]